MNEVDELTYALYPEEVTGTLGQWFELDTSEIPAEAMKFLQMAYSICEEMLK